MLAAFMAGTVAALAVPPGVVPGVYTNEEEVYFDTLAKRVAAPWTGLRIDGAAVVAVDAYGATVNVPAGMLRASSDRLTLTLADGRTSELRRARPVTCWGSVPRATGRRSLALSV